jgi:membrane protein implicated in regulation of membrane protease activity
MNELNYLLPLLLVLLVGWRFLRRFRQETRRQHILTWPRATAELAGAEDELVIAARDRHGVPIFYRAELNAPYTFYARGEKYSGERLAPELRRFNPAEAKVFLSALGRQRRYEVTYNPQDPAENYLTVGRPLLTNGKLLVFALIGVAVPLGLLALPFWLDGLVVFVVALFVACYYTFQPVYDLGKLLQPTPPMDELLERLAEAHQPSQSPHVIYPNSRRT